MFAHPHPLNQHTFFLCHINCHQYTKYILNLSNFNTRNFHEIQILFFIFGYRGLCTLQVIAGKHILYYTMSRKNLGLYFLKTSSIYSNLIFEY